MMEIGSPQPDYLVIRVFLETQAEAEGLEQEANRLLRLESPLHVSCGRQESCHIKCE